MKVCFIVLAHHQPQILKKLLLNISWGNSNIIVHVDKRSDINNFVTTEYQNVYYMQKRRRVNRSGWSLTKTICEALEYGLKVSDADYFIYLAGTDFPIKRHTELIKYLEDNYPTNFLNYYPLVPGIWGYQLIERFWLNDLKAPFIDLRNNMLSTSTLRKNLADLVLKMERNLNKLLRPRNTSWINFYSGSDRWCLNRETVKFVVAYYRSRKSLRLRNYLRLCANSDEIFFQTAILNSIHKIDCSGFDECEAIKIFNNQLPPFPDEKKVNFTYVDWSEEREDPAILVESDFQRLKDSGDFFATKFMDDKSLNLVELIESELLVQR